MLLNKYIISYTYVYTFNMLFKFQITIPFKIFLTNYIWSLEAEDNIRALTFYLCVEVIDNNLQLCNIHVCQDLSADPSFAVREWNTNLPEQQHVADWGLSHHASLE